jgi:two-component system, OmpR family, response regulator
MRILLAEADAPLAESFRQQLKQEHFAVQVAGNSEEVQTFAAKEGYALLVLGLNLPGESNVELLRRMKSARADLSVLVVAGPSGVEERVRALDAGADDYVVRPVAFAELAARIRAILRRSNRPAAETVLTVGDLAMDRLGHTVQRDGRPLDLSPREFALLEFLMRNAGQAVTRTSIVEHVWKVNCEATTNVVDVYINYLRRKVDKGYEQALIRTVRGIGYLISGNGAGP